jgi:hypothetical protein
MIRVDHFLLLKNSQPIPNITINTRKKAHHIPALKIPSTTEQPGKISKSKARKNTGISFICFVLSCYLNHRLSSRSTECKWQYMCPGLNGEVPAQTAAIRSCLAPNTHSIHKKCRKNSPKWLEGHSFKANSFRHKVFCFFPAGFWQLSPRTCF